MGTLPKSALKKIHPRTPVLCVGVGITAVAAERDLGQLGTSPREHREFPGAKTKPWSVLPAQNNVLEEPAAILWRAELCSPSSHPCPHGCGLNSRAGSPGSIPRDRSHPAASCWDKTTGRKAGVVRSEVFRKSGLTWRKCGAEGAVAGLEGRDQSRGCGCSEISAQILQYPAAARGPETQQNLHKVTNLKNKVLGNKRNGKK